MPLIIGRRPGHAFRQCDAQPSASALDERVRSKRAVGVAETPVLLRIAKVTIGQVVETVAFDDAMLLNQREVLGRRYESAFDVRDTSAVGRRVHRRPNPVIPAAWRKDLREKRVRFEKRLYRIHQPIPPMPTDDKLPAVA